MPTEKIVINASPLILLCKSDLESLLPGLFNEILIPNAVWDEINLGDDIALSKIKAATWLKRVNVDLSDDVVVWNLGDGESEVLSFAFAYRDHTAVLDDRAARNCAKTLGYQNTWNRCDPGVGKTTWIY